MEKGCENTGRVTTLNCQPTHMAPSNDTEGNTQTENEPRAARRSGGNQTKILGRRIAQAVAVGMVLAGLVVGAYYYRDAVSHESTDDAFIDGDIIPISPRVSGHVAGVYVTDNQKVAAGDLLAELDPSDFQTRLDAARASLHSAEAEKCSRDIDVNLTSITAMADLEEANAAVAAADAMVQNALSLAAGSESQQGEAEAQVAYAKAALDQARAELAAEEAKYQQAFLDLKRYRELARSNTISPQQLDHIETTERMAAADLTAARSKAGTQQSLLQRAESSLKAAGDNVRQNQAQVTARIAQREQAKARLASARSAPVQVSQSSSRAEASKADVESARAMVEQATLDLSYTRIVAPTDGYVTNKNIEPGVYVQVGQSLMAIVTPNVWVTANFKETQLDNIRPGQPAMVSVDAFPDTPLHARVDSIQRGTGSRFSLLPPENATGNFVKVVQRIPVKIVFDRAEEYSRHRLVPGMSVVTRVDIKAEPPPTATEKSIQKSDSLPATPHVRGQ